MRQGEIFKIAALPAPTGAASPGQPFFQFRDDADQQVLQQTGEIRLVDVACTLPVAPCGENVLHPGCKVRRVRFAHPGVLKAKFCQGPQIRKGCGDGSLSNGLSHNWRSVNTVRFPRKSVRALLGWLCPSWRFLSWIKFPKVVSSLPSIHNWSTQLILPREAGIEPDRLLLCRYNFSQPLRYLRVGGRATQLIIGVRKTNQ